MMNDGSFSGGWLMVMGVIVMSAKISVVIFEDDNENN